MQRIQDMFINMEEVAEDAYGSVLPDVKNDLHTLRFPCRADTPDIQISLLHQLLQYPVDLFPVLTG